MYGTCKHQRVANMTFTAGHGGVPGDGDDVCACARAPACARWAPWRVREAGPMAEHSFAGP